MSRMARLQAVGEQLRKARAELESILVEVEDQFAKIAVYPGAMVPIYKVGAREDRKPGRLRHPVAWLHFEEGHLRLSQTPQPYDPQRQLKPCPRCRKVCTTCTERRKANRKRWDEQEAAKAKPTDVLEIVDSTLLAAVVAALPALRKRLEDDAKITPEELQEAAAEARKFIAKLERV